MSSIFIFVSGAALLIYSAEKLIGYLVGVASALGISLFLLAVVFTGIEFDDVFLGVTLNLEGLGGVALGTVFGTAVAMSGIVLALAAIVTPTEVNIPRDHVVVFAAAPLVMILFLTVMAPLTTIDGILLIALFVSFIAYVAIRESKGGTPVFRDAEMYEASSSARGPSRAPAHDARAHAGNPDGDREGDRDGDREGDEGREPPGGRPGGAGEPHLSESVPFADAHEPSGWAGLGLAVLALAGLIIGVATTSLGTEGILRTYGLKGTTFGATIATVVLSMDDIFLTVEPVRRGAPEIGVGNVIGSVVFSITGKLGIILLAGGLVVGEDVRTWHLPALIVVTGLAAYFLSTGRLKRWHGCTLLGLYLVYWVVSLAVFGAAPIEPP